MLGLCRFLYFLFPPYTLLSTLHCPHKAGLDSSLAAGLLLLPSPLLGWLLALLLALLLLLLLLFLP